MGKAEMRDEWAKSPFPELSPCGSKNDEGEGRIENAWPRISIERARWNYKKRFIHDYTIS